MASKHLSKWLSFSLTLCVLAVVQPSRAASCTDADFCNPEVLLNFCDNSTSCTVTPDYLNSLGLQQCACAPGFKAAPGLDAWRFPQSLWTIPGHEHRVYVPIGTVCDTPCDSVGVDGTLPEDICDEVPFYSCPAPTPSTTPSASAAPSPSSSSSPAPSIVCNGFCSSDPSLNQCTSTTSCSSIPSIFGSDALMCVCRPGYRPANNSGVAAWRFGDDTWGVAGQSHRVYVAGGAECDQLCDGVADGLVAPSEVCAEVPLYDTGCVLPSPSTSVSPSFSPSATPEPSTTPSLSAAPSPSTIPPSPAPLCNSQCSADPSSSAQCGLGAACATTAAITQGALMCVCQAGYKPAAGVFAYRFSDSDWGIAGQSHRVYVATGTECLELCDSSSCSEVPVYDSQCVIPSVSTSPSAFASSAPSPAASSSSAPAVSSSSAPAVSSSSAPAVSSSSAPAVSSSSAPAVSSSSAPAPSVSNSPVAAASNSPVASPSKSAAAAVPTTSAAASVSPSVSPFSNLTQAACLGVCGFLPGALSCDVTTACIGTTFSAPMCVCRPGYRTTLDKPQWRLSVAEWSGQQGQEHRVFVPAGDSCNELCNSGSTPTTLCSEVPEYDQVCSTEELQSVIAAISGASSNGVFGSILALALGATLSMLL